MSPFSRRSSSLYFSHLSAIGLPQFIHLIGIIILVEPPIFELCKTILAPRFHVGNAEELKNGKHYTPPEMTSLLYSSGLNFQNGNPLGRKVRALETEIESMRKEILALKGGTVTTTATASVSPSLQADIDFLKRDVAAIKAAGYGKGEKGDKGDKGDKGEKGDPGPMTYIAMPSTAAVPLPTATQTPVSA